MEKPLLLELKVNSIRGKMMMIIHRRWQRMCRHIDEKIVHKLPEEKLRGDSKAKRDTCLNCDKPVCKGDCERMKKGWQS